MRREKCAGDEWEGEEGAGEACASKSAWAGSVRAARKIPAGRIFLGRIFCFRDFWARRLLGSGGAAGRGGRAAGGQRAAGGGVGGEKTNNYDRPKVLAEKRVGARGNTKRDQKLVPLPVPIPTFPVANLMPMLDFHGLSANLFLSRTAESESSQH